MLHDAVFEQKATSRWLELSQETSYTVSILFTIPRSDIWRLRIAACGCACSWAALS